MSLLGTYFCGSGAIGGSGSAQNLLSIENPNGSGVLVVVKSLVASGVVDAVSTAKFFYRFGRTSGMPSSGGTLQAQKRNDADATPAAIVRTAPTATAATGDLWTAPPGVILGTLVATVSSFTPGQLKGIEDVSGLTDFELAPNSGLLVRASANTAAWDHFVNLIWQEST